MALESMKYPWRGQHFEKHRPLDAMVFAVKSARASDCRPLCHGCREAAAKPVFPKY
jgi:hypothetical protein